MGGALEILSKNYWSTAFIIHFIVINKWNFTLLVFITTHNL